MIPAIVIGRGQSKGFPGKNKYKINDKQLLTYPIQAAYDSNYVDECYFSTDDKELAGIANFYEAKIIDRPKELATDEALGEDVFVHAYNHIKELMDMKPVFTGNTGIKYVVLMFANAPCITGQMIDKMIDMLDDNIFADSCCTISRYNMFSPYRMRQFPKIDKKVIYNNQLFNFIQDQDNTTCDRDSSGDFYLYDCSCAVVRPYCLEHIEDGLPPQRWLGQDMLGYKQDIPALDIDYEWQLGQIQYWLDNHKEK